MKDIKDTKEVIMKHFKKLFLILTALYLILPAILSAQMTWTCACSSAQWSARYGHTSVVFDNKMWVLGGYYYCGGGSGVYYNDVWYSTDGVNWAQVTDSAEWSARAYHTSVVFDNKIWVIGGSYPDVWFSTNGINWTQATDSAGWLARSGHTSVVFDNKMWVIGGIDNILRNDVWYSTNGVNWNQVTDSAEWSGRGGHTSVVFDNKMWVMGGVTSGISVWPIFLSDIWNSTDGVDWTQVTANAGCVARDEYTAVVFDNKVWVKGGVVVAGGLPPIIYHFASVYYSSECVNWNLATANAGWSGRAGHTSVVFGNKIWVIGGADSSDYRNDVWYSAGLGIEEHSTPYEHSISPNATIVRGVLNLQSEITNPQSEIVLLDITGRKVADLKSGVNNIRYLAPGVYFIRRNNNNKVTKIIITK
jgi:hypothetical protein